MNEKLTILLEHIKQANGLQFKLMNTEIEISQKQDKKSICIQFDQIEEILVRNEIDNKKFLQVNFVNGNKILVTDELIGFKPIPQTGLKFDKLPKVVTTTDLVSVFEAAEEALTSGTSSEVEALKQVFHAILKGGENVGFDLTMEKSWFNRLNTKNASA